MATAGCDLGGLPQAPQPEPLPPEVTPPEARRLVCAPSARVCRQNGGVEVCDADGEGFEVEVCEGESFCSGGTCLPIANTCRDGELFSLSTSYVMFDQPENLKPVTDALMLLNCGDQPLTLEKAQIQSALNTTGQPVFSFERNSPEGIQLDPGVPLRIGLTFRPQNKQWVERARLTLRARVGDDVVEQQVPMASRAWCLRTSPQVDVGVFDVRTGARGQAHVHNCGTMPITVVGTSSTPTPTIKEPERLRAPSFDSPKVIAPGATRTFEVQVERAVPGALRARLELSVPSQDSVYLQDPASTSIPIVGHAYDGGLPCVDRPVFLPTPQGSEGTSQQPLPPMVEHRWDTSQRDDQWDTVISRHAAPKGAPSAMAHLHDTHEFRLTPYWVGRYDFDVMGVQSQTGARTCDRELFTVEVAPRDDLYAQLSWEDVDAKLGAGAELDLHVRLTTPETATSSTWGVPTHDCFAQGAGKTSCFGGQAVMLAPADASAPEVFRFNARDPEDVRQRFDFGVLVRHMGSADHVRPTLRVWRDGVALEGLDHLTRSLQAPSSFWLAASYYAASSLSAVLDFVLQGLPGRGD